MAQARLREALNAGGPGPKEKGPPVADGILSVTPDTPEAVEWRSRRSIIDSAGASSSYLEDDTGWWGRRLGAGHIFRSLERWPPAGPKPSELYGKFTWKIENFTEISKRELRSNIFEVGNYKWCALQPATALYLWCRACFMYIAPAGTSWCTPRAAMSVTTSRYSSAWRTMTSCCLVSRPGVCLYCCSKAASNSRR